jgi:hypothetical protein
MLPLDVWLDGARQSMHWGFDLIAGKAYRARGYHRPIVYELQVIPELILVSPNDMSRFLLKRAGWRLRWDGRRCAIRPAPTAICSRRPRGCPA